MPNLIESLGYIKCYSWSSLRPVKSPSNSIRYNVRQSNVDHEDLNQQRSSEKRPDFPKHLLVRKDKIKPNI